MEKTHLHKPKIPLTEHLKTVPDVLGIRLNEQPDYDVLIKDGDVEIRKYHKTLIAQIEVQGQHEEAIKEGFMTLANFIFGENTTRSYTAYTVPVYPQAASKSESIPMTAPVLQEKYENGWKVSFVMPEKFDCNSVPVPDNANIHFKELPERKTAVYQYRGNNDEEKMHHAEHELVAWLATSGSTAKSSIRWAQYDPPFTIPFLKRNEAQIDIQ